MYDDLDDSDSDLDDPEPIVCSECGQTAGADYCIHDKQVYCFACYYAEFGD